MMYTKSTVIVLVAAITLLSGALGIAMMDTFNDQKIGVSNVDTGLMTGHLEIEARNADGELFAYRQTDNEVVDDGEQCILKMLFASTNSSGVGRGDAAGTDDCVGKLVGAWDVIAIGTTTTAAAETNVKLGNETAGVPGLERAHASKTWTNTTGAANNNKIELTKTFTLTGSNEHIIRETGLFNITESHHAQCSGLCQGSIGTHHPGSGMLAHKVFSAVTLATGDSITITWTFQVGN